jgi:hypothetical protein
VNLEEHVLLCFDAACGQQGDVIDRWAAPHRMRLREAALDRLQTFQLEPTPSTAAEEKRHGSWGTVQGARSPTCPNARPTPTPLIVRAP